MKNHYRTYRAKLWVMNKMGIWLGVSFYVDGIPYGSAPKHIKDNDYEEWSG